MAVTCSPVVTSRPPSRASTSSAKSMPRKCRRTVSAVAVRSRWVSTSRLPALLAGLELDLAAEHVDGRLEVDDPGDGVLLALADGAVQGRRRDGLGARDGEPRAHAGALVDRAGLAQRAGEAGQDLDEVVGHGRDEVGLLPDDRDLVLDLERVVGADLRAEAVLERGDDAAAVGVVLGVRAGHHQHVEGQPQHVAADLDVALLHHVEHRDLDPLGEVGQLVDGDDAPVAARDEPEVDRVGVAEGAALRDLHRVDVADQVGDRGVRGGQLLGVPLLPVAPRHRQVVAELLGPPPRPRRDRVEGVLAELAALDHRRPLVEQPHQGAQQPGLPLPPLAEQDDVVPGDQRALELGYDGGVEAVQAGPGVLARGQLGQQVGADLLAQRPVLVPDSRSSRTVEMVGAVVGDPGEVTITLLAHNVSGSKSGPRR